MLGELNEKEKTDFLKSHSIGRIGCSDGENVYIVPISYQFEEDSILCYSLNGLKIDIMRHHSAVCFEVDEITDPFNWKCVLVNGVFEEITNKSELDLLRPHYTEYFLRNRTRLPSPSLLNEENTGDKDNLINSDQVFYRIRIHKISGRFMNG